MSYKEALNGSDSENWKLAIQEELNSINKNNTWCLVKRKEINSKNILTSRWLFKKKNNPEKSIIYKARLMIRGFQDKNTYDCTETYAPVIRFTDFRFLVSVASKYNLEMHQMDFKTDFLNGKINEEIYVCARWFSRQRKT